ncbi:MAG: peptidoglycan recognition family protein [Kofleriaceae bacterium]
MALTPARAARSRGCAVALAVALAGCGGQAGAVEPGAGAERAGAGEAGGPPRRDGSSGAGAERAGAGEAGGPPRRDGSSGAGAERAGAGEAGEPPRRDGSSGAASTSPAPSAVAPAEPAPPPVGAFVEWPLRWSDARAAATLAYRRRHESPDVADLEIQPRVIVLHYTGGGSARGTKAYFDSPTIEAARGALARAGKVNVSSHFLVDRDGVIYRLQPETRFARHCIGLNHLAIGVENVGDEARWPLTDAQVSANAALVRDLTRRFPITHLLGHHEVMAFRSHPYYVEREPSYRNRKGDPGARFLAAVRTLVEDLGLQGLGDADAAAPR